MLTIYHNPRCTKSRQTLERIRAAGQEPEVIEYLKTPVSAAELKALLTKLGISAQELLRKGEAIYKAEYKGKDLSEDEWIEAMVAHPKLIERPIVVLGDRAILGRPPENVDQLL